MDDKDVHFENAPSPIETTLFGMIICHNAVQPLKVSLSILTMLLGITIDSISVHP